MLDFKWNEGIESLKQYKAQHNSMMVPVSFKTSNGFLLGRWVSHARGNKKKGNLSKERIAQLDALGFIWDVSREK